jgi:hypothetical protein
MFEDRSAEIAMQPALGPDTTQRLAELRREMRRYQDRYGELAGMVDVSKANSAMAARQRRLDKLREEEERVRSQIDSMTSEVQRIEKWLEFCLEDAIGRAKRDHAEGWSPRPVYGYRVWGVSDEELHGVKMPWTSRKLVATCLSRGDVGEIPHSDGRCGRLGCGVYAAKTVDPLYKEFNVWGMNDVALGLVALTGKVVEHDNGYRAAEATVVALGAKLDGHQLLTTDPDEIDAVFADPTLIHRAPRVDSMEQSLAEMEVFVNEEARRAEQWI